MSKIFVVYYELSDYEDHTFRNIKAFNELAKAEAFAMQLFVENNKKVKRRKALYKKANDTLHKKPIDMEKYNKFNNAYYGIDYDNPNGYYSIDIIDLE